MDGKRHVFEAEMKQDRRTPGRPATPRRRTSRPPADAGTSAVEGRPDLVEHGLLALADLLARRSP